MKIAVCFFGISRNFSKYTLDSIERQFFSVVRKHDPHFKRFAHINQLTELTNERTGEKNIAIDPDEYKLLGCDVVNQTDQRLVDQQIDFDYLKQFGNAGEEKKESYTTLKNVLRQYYSLNAVTDILERENAGFDLVIYSRICLGFKMPIEIPRIIRPRNLYTPWFDRYRGLNDRFGLGDVETMVAYGRRQSMARVYCEEKNRPMGAEHYLYWYMKRLGFKNQFLTTMNFSRVRADGAERIPRDEKWRFCYKRALEIAGLRGYS
jgi:hypothetical protein